MIVSFLVTGKIKIGLKSPYSLFFLSVLHHSFPRAADENAYKNHAHAMVFDGKGKRRTRAYRGCPRYSPPHTSDERP